MPIRVNCSCGKALGLKDEYAGKTIRCPACKQPLKVPAAGGAAPAQPSAQPPASISFASPSPAPSSGGMAGFFDEEGMNQLTGPVCPGCAKEMKPGTIICMNCGMNATTGQRLQGHTQAQQAASRYGNAALDEAAAHMKRDADVQKSIGGQGLPWWALAGILILLATFGVVGVQISVALTSDAEAGTKGAALLTALLLGCALIVNLVCTGVILTYAFRESIGRGFAALLIPFYILYFGFSRPHCRGYMTASIVSNVVLNIINAIITMLLASD